MVCTCVGWTEVALTLTACCLMSFRYMLTWDKILEKYIYTTYVIQPTHKRTHQITVMPRVEANTRAAQLLAEDEGAFWLELLTPGTILATTMVVEVVDGNARVNAIANLGVGAMRVTFIRPRTPD